MNTFSKFMIGLISASSLALGAGVAQAHGDGPDGCPMGGPGGKGKMMSPERMAAHLDQHLAQMKKELKITEQQEPLWQAYAEQKKQGLADMAKAMQAHKDDSTKLSAPERMERMSAMMKTHLDQQQATLESFKRLYGAFSDEQKAAADKLFARPPMGMQPHKHGHKPQGDAQSHQHDAAAGGTQQQN